MQKYNMNFGWKFHDGVPAETGFGRDAGDKRFKTKWAKVTDFAEALTGYPDNDWQDVDLPHDFIIARSNFSSDNVSNTGSLGVGIGYYRKSFKIPADTYGKRVFFEVDGAYRDSEVWCNGAYIDRTMGGFVSTSYEITEALDYEGTNTLLITCDSQDPEGWWYTGGGVYRDVRLVIVPKVCFEYNGIYIKTANVDLDTKKCDFEIIADVDNNEYEDIASKIDIKIYDDENCIVEKSWDFEIENKEYNQFKNKFSIENTKLWCPNSPNLYKAVVCLTTKFGTHDEEITFGAKKIEYNAKTGMKINGEPIFLTGVCCHDDHAGVGTALNRSVIEYRVDILKQIGCNAYRCSHNPPNPIFLDVCDEKGILVMDETRRPAISDSGMDEFIKVIKRDRNHASVFCWSTWNEESLIHGKDIGVRIFNKMKNIGSRYDDTRDYLMAINTTYSEVIAYNEEHGMKLPLNGVNYLEQRDFGVLERMHKNHPDMCLMNTEVSSDCTIRGYNLFDGEPTNVNEKRLRVTDWPARKNRRDKQGISCYSDCYPTWGENIEETLKVYEGQNHVLGFFIWTAFDYRGEINPYLFPNVISLYGIIDYCGFLKDWAYYLKAMKTEGPQIYFMPSTWNLPEEEGANIDVYVMSNCNEMELFLNGKSLGRKTKEKLDNFYYEVPYEKGELKAVGYIDGKVAVENKIATSGKEYKLVLETKKTTLKANGDDCSMIAVKVVDENGLDVTDSKIDVKFEISEKGKLVGTGNGNPLSHENDKLPQRKLFWGKALVIVGSQFEEGEIEVKAISDGVESASITLTAVKEDISGFIFNEGNTELIKLQSSMEEC